ncbi:anterior gradient protein 2-like [Ambystoma mexicanum]|uniref:Thioredoxin domain-containing secreted protein Ag1 n=1 Tax=Ambystoma mexicanum TaxID=8296 RepID=M1S1T8_AMBME|nr:thioredoxin domain-containing secreted protein Ag1 [Ambystoma mexicanum]
MQLTLTLCCLLMAAALGEAAMRKPKKQPGADGASPDKDGHATEKGDQPTVKGDQDTEKVTMPQTLSRGWGDEIEWIQTYEEALASSRASKKPLMVIHHLDECPYSQALKKAFVADPLVQKMAKENFVMLNVVHPIADANLAPDGQYVPRIMFIDPSLTVRTDIAGRYGNRLYAYESEDIPELITSMKKARVLLHTEL